MPYCTFSNSVSGLETRTYYTTSNNSSANTTTITARMQARKTDGYTTYGTYSGAVNINGNWISVSSATVSIGSSWINVGGSASRTISHNADGSKTTTIGSRGLVSGTSWGTTQSGTCSVTLTDYTRVPGAPTNIVIDNITPTTADYDWTNPSTVGGGITGYRWQVSETNFGDVFRTGTQKNSTIGSSNPLNPGTTYYFRARCSSSDGWGAWSSVVSFTTLPSSSPSIVVTASPTGTSATVSLTAPGGITGVDSYEIQYRVKGSSTATTVTTTSTTRTVTGLTPGTTYEWRSRAIIGTYTSPWTDWTEVTQPAPSTEPGAFFDGSTTATDDQTYQWTGTEHLSTSEAVGQTALGWRGFALGATDSGGTGAMAWVTDPYGSVGTKAVRSTFFTDATAAGFRAGPIGTANHADVTEYNDYTASLYVKPSRSQRLALQIRWYDSGDAELSVDQGTAQVIGSGVYTRMTMTAESPAGAEFASIEVVDVEGTGWSLWLSGQSITTDAAMLSIGNQVYAYFDGDYPDVTGYSYEWTGDANASSSIRNDEEVAATNPLADPDCDDLPTPPRPPSVPDTCIEEIALWRRYTIVVPASYTYDWQDVVPSFRLTTAEDYPEIPGAIRQVRIRVYPNPFGYNPEDVDTSTWCAEMIISYIPSDTVLLIDGEIQRVFAEVQGAASIPADHLIYGTGGTPPTWPVLECGIAYMVTVDTPLEGLTPLEDLKPEIILTRKF